MPKLSIRFTDLKVKSHFFFSQEKNTKELILGLPLSSDNSENCDFSEGLGLQTHILTWQHGVVTSGLQEKARHARYAVTGFVPVGTMQFDAQEQRPLMMLGHQLEQGLITDVVAIVKGGKEASVYRCQAHPATGMKWLAAKVYRPRKFRNLRNDKMYRQGRAVLSADGSNLKNSDLRALAPRRAQSLLRCAPGLSPGPTPKRSPPLVPA